MAKAKGDIVITLGAKASAGMKNAFNVAKKNLKQIKAIGKQAFAFGKFAAIGGVALAGSLTAIIAKSTATGDAFDKMSARTGLGAEFLANLTHAANLGGTSIGAIEKGIKIGRAHV